MARWTTLAAALALTSGLALQAHAESLSDTLVQAYQSSPLLEQQRILLRVTDDDVAVAVSALRPAVNLEYAVTKFKQDSPFNGTVGTTTTNSIDLVARYTLLDGGQRAFRIGAAKEAVLEARYALIETEQQVLLQATAAYLNLREALLIVDVRESNLRLLSEQLRAARDRFEVGEVTRTDVSLAEARLASAQSLLAAARGTVDISREEYRAVTGNLPTGTLQAPPTPPDLPPSLERAQALALQVHPLITSGQYGITALTLLADAAEADRLPQLSATGVLGFDDDRTSSGTISITGDIPIYNGGRLSALNRQALLQAQAARSGLAGTAREVTRDLGTAWSQLEIARAQIIASREAVRASRLAFEGFQEEALLGARTTLDVLDAEQELLDARTTLLEAETTAQLAVYQVLAEIGLLTTDHLGLSVQRYDPSQYYRAVSTAPAVSPSAQGGRLDSVLRRFGRN